MINYVDCYSNVIYETSIPGINSHWVIMYDLLNFFSMATPAACGISVPGIESKMRLWLTQGSYRNTGSFNPPQWAGDWTQASAVTWSTAVGFLMHCRIFFFFNVHLWEKQNSHLFSPWIPKIWVSVPSMYVMQLNAPLMR